MAQEDSGLTLTLGNFLPPHEDIIHALYKDGGKGFIFLLLSSNDLYSESCDDHVSHSFTC